MGKRGLFIVFEGIDGVGKSLHARKLVRFLKSQNIKAIYTKEPSNGMLGRQIKHKLRTESNPNKEWLHVMFASDREHHTEEIKRYLSNGINVVCDRYILSGIVHATLDIGSTKAQKINKGLLKPDMTILLIDDVLKASKRINSRKTSLEVYPSPNQLNRLQVLFKDIGRKRKNIRIIPIDSTTETHKQILYHVRDIIEFKLPHEK